jgi:hypothetical protein
MSDKEHICEFCKKVFKKPSTLGSHICPTKNRWLSRTKKDSIIGFEAWQQFYMTGFTNKKVRTYEEYIVSPYYAAFSRFGTYCMDVQALNIPRYIDWLLKEQVKIDLWNKDTTYNKFLINYLKVEDPLDAIARSIETTIKLSDSSQASDYFRKTHPNQVCHQVTLGRISPWALFQSDSGVEFLSNLDQDQEKIVLPYIDPTAWSIKFIRDPKTASEIKEIMGAAGY